MNTKDEIADFDKKCSKKIFVQARDIVEKTVNLHLKTAPENKSTLL